MRAIRRILAGGRGGRPVSAELQRELDSDPPWMYRWDVGGRTPRLLHSELPSVHETRREMIEPAVRAELERAGPQARALDLACSEGWFSQLLLEWGAAEVVGIDVRESNVRRAELMRDHNDISAERLRFMQADVRGLDDAALGSFDVVLMLGLVYHLEDPTGAVRAARRLTGGLCVIESQLTRQRDPIEHGWGASGTLLSAPASFAVYVEPDSDENPIASSGRVLSLVPNLAALREMASAAGFEQVEKAEAGPGHNEQYTRLDRSILFCR